MKTLSCRDGSILNLADVNVGDRFIVDSRKLYNDGPRHNQFHQTSVLVKVVRIDGACAYYTVIEVLSNINPPSWITAGCGHTDGGFTIIEDLFRLNTSIRRAADVAKLPELLPAIQTAPGGGGTVRDSDVMATINRDIDKRIGLPNAWTGADRRGE